MNWFRENRKGILLSLAVALAAAGLGSLFPLIGGAVFAIVLGIAVGNFVGKPEGSLPGIRFTGKRILQWAVVVLGGGLSLKQVYVTGISSLSIMVFTLSSAFLTAIIVGRILHIPFKMTSLIGMGTAICGGSAIAAISPIIEAEDQDIAYAISTVFMFNVVAVLIFPALGHWMNMSSHGFGMWAGTSINDTSSVVAAAYSYSNESGAYATIVKLTRTTMIIPLSLVFAATMAFKSGSTSGTGRSRYSFLTIFPWFILWFLAASLLNTAGIISPRYAAACTDAGKFLIVLAMSAIGLNSDLGAMRRTGGRPILLGLIVWIVVAATSVFVQGYSGQW